MSLDTEINLYTIQRNIEYLETIEIIKKDGMKIVIP